MTTPVTHQDVDRQADVQLLIALLEHDSADGVGGALRQLNALHAKERAAVLDMALSAQVTRIEVLKVLTAAVDAMGAELHDDVQEAMHFFLFTLYADTERDPASADSLTNHYLASPLTRRFIERQYGTGEVYPDDTLHFYRMGSTSYILSLATSRRVLKILRWTARKDPFLTDQTARYKTMYKDFTYAPPVEACGPYYVLMEFIAGPTLREYIKAGPEDKLSMLSRLGDLLCDALGHYAEQGTLHLDLSPDNVIVEGGGSHIRLIDFGYNYALHEGTTSIKLLASAQRYIDPALLKNPRMSEATGEVAQRVGEFADIYSLGVIFLQLLAPDDNSGLALAHAWEQYPPFAALIEDMIDEDPVNRLLLFAHRSGPAKYSELRERLKQEVRIEQAVQQEAKRWHNPIAKVLSIVEPGFAGIAENVARINELNADASRQRTTRRLLYSLIAAEALNAITVVFFIKYLYADSGLETLTLADVFRQPHLLGDTVAGHSGVLLQNIPGRMVALSFSVLASRYYHNIFSMISLGVLNKALERLVRSMAFVLWIPIWVALFYRPSWWPWCSFVGVMLVAVNNAVMYRFTRLHRDEFKFTLPESEAIQAFDGEFGHWGWDMTYYGATIALLGVLLATHLAGDEWVYASIVVALNYLIQRNNCVKRAPMVKAGCQRMVTRLLRSRVRDGRLALQAMGGVTSPSKS